MNFVKSIQMSTPSTSKREAGLTPTANTLMPMCDNSQMFGADKEPLIRHIGGLYHLRVARQNKLILTK